MQHKTYFCILLMSSLVLTGCLKVQKKSETATAKVAQPQSTKKDDQKKVITRELRLDDVFIELRGQSQPDVYDMLFSWPETMDRVRVSVSGQVMFAVNTADRSEEAVVSLQGGTRVPVLIEILDQKYHVITSEVRDVEVPKDYIFPNTFKLSNNMKIQNERVFLDASIITTENFNLEIKTKKLIVLNKSRIQNFVPDTKAKHGFNGRSGGLISIDAEVAEGDLNFLMNSESGGDALKGFFHAIGDLSGTGYATENAYCVFGTNGFAAGKNGDLNLKVKDITRFRQYTQQTLSEGGQLAPVVHTKGDNPNYPSLTFNQLIGDICPNRPSLGANAQPGKVCLTFAGQVPQAGCE